MAGTNVAGQDIISVKNLQLPYGIVAPDVWGKPKEQPALVTLTLVLKTSFASAANKDALDNSTIHYGELAKRLRAACAQGQTAGHVSGHAEHVITEMAQKADGSFVLARSVVEVNLPKASMYGEGVTLMNVSSYDDGGRVAGTQRIFVVKEVKVMLLLGVNNYERSGKQPVIVSLWLYLGDGSDVKESGQTVALFNLEQMVIQIMQDTSFETLESLANFTVTQLQKRLLNQMLPGSQIQLRLEKPRAIAFADAPAVEVFRETPSAKRKPPVPVRASAPPQMQIQAQAHQRSGTLATIASSAATSVQDSIISGTERLSVIRPYV